MSEIISIVCSIVIIASAVESIRSLKRMQEEDIRRMNKLKEIEDKLYSQEDS